MGKFGLNVVCLYPELDKFGFDNLKKYETYTVMEVLGDINDKGLYYINNFWYSKKCFVSLCDFRRQKIEHLKTKICGFIK